MYFRGPVLTHFDGVEWRPLGLPYAPLTLPARPPALKTSGAPLSYEATFEPLRLGSIPLLEATTEIRPVDGYRIVAREDLQWLAERPVIERLRFRAVASTRFVLGAPRHIGELQEALDLPDGFNPRTIAWAHAFRDAPARARRERAAARECAAAAHPQPGLHLHAGAGRIRPQRASTSSGSIARRASASTSPSAFVVVMRAIGVPARIVTGYQGTDLPPIDDYYIVRQSSAHAWAEYWQSGVGWIRADPTGAVAPDRINRSSRLAPQPGFVAGTLDAMSPQLFARLRGSWEAINNRWNQWILNYSRGQQFDVLKQIGFASPSLGGPGAAAGRCAEQAGARRRALGLARSPSRRPVGAPARAHQARAARARRRRGGARGAAHARGARRASASAAPASRSPRCSMRSSRSATAAPRASGPTGR